MAAGIPARCRPALDLHLTFRHLDIPPLRRSRPVSKSADGAHTSPPLTGVILRRAHRPVLALAYIALGEPGGAMKKRLGEHPSTAGRWSLSSRCVGDRVRSHLDSIHAYIARDNPQAASKVIQQIVDRVDDLAANPSLDSSRPGRVAGTRELVIPAAYVIPFLIRVFHARQRWPDKLP